jgi:hypothetical protein
MAANLLVDSVWTRKTTRCFSSLLAWCCAHSLVSQSRSSPQLGEGSLVAEVLADARCCHEKRLHNNQPEWTKRHERGATKSHCTSRAGGAGGQEAST